MNLLKNKIECAKLFIIYVIFIEKLNTNIGAIQDVNIRNLINQ